MNTGAVRAREAARQRDGRFGIQPRSRASATLGGYEPQVVIAPDGSHITQYQDAAGQLHREGGPAKEVFTPGGAHIVECYRHGRLHNLHAPARQVYDEDWGLVAQEWFVDGRPVNLDGKAHATTFYPDEIISSQRWVNADGMLHRHQGPAVIRYDRGGSLLEHQYWYDGQPTSPDGNAHSTVFYPGGPKRAQSWVSTDKNLHRVDGPAYVAWDMHGNVTEREYWTDGVWLSHDAKDYSDFMAPYQKMAPGTFGKRGWTVETGAQDVIRDKINPGVEALYSNDDPNTPILRYAAFGGLDARDCNKLSQTMPEAALSYRLNWAPTASSLLAAGGRYHSQLQPLGYVTGPDSRNESIVLQGFSYHPAPGEDVSWPSIQRKFNLDAEYAPDEIAKRSDGTWRMVWD